jgi:hypothetical protein
VQTTQRKGMRAWFLDASQPERAGFYEEKPQATSHHHVETWWTEMYLSGAGLEGKAMENHNRNAGQRRGSTVSTRSTWSRNSVM